MRALSNCCLCERLHDFRLQQRQRYPHYFNRPVPAVGSPSARLLVVGLAPGLHGATATGVPFTGDASGEQLHRALCRHDFARRLQDDAVELLDCRITNAVKCLPPGNRPSTREMNTCNPYLRRELDQLDPAGAVLALGGLAHRAILRALDLAPSRYRFGHRAEHPLPRGWLLFDSYHCSRYNFNTGRLDETSFDAVFRRLREYLQ